MSKLNKLQKIRGDTHRFRLLALLSDRTTTAVNGRIRHMCAFTRTIGPIVHSSTFKSLRIPARYSRVKRQTEAKRLISLLRIYLDQVTHESPADSAHRNAHLRKKTLRSERSSVRYCTALRARTARSE